MREHRFYSREEYGMTRRQRDLLTFITQYFFEHGYAPSFQEMADNVGLRSKSGIHRLVHALHERGKIRCLPNRVRTIEPVFDQVLQLRLPVEIDVMLRERAKEHGEDLQTAVVRVLRNSFYPNTSGV